MTYFEAFQFFKEKRMKTSWFQSFPTVPASELDNKNLSIYFFGLISYFTGMTSMDDKTLQVGRILLREMLNELVKRKRLSKKYATSFEKLISIPADEGKEALQP